MKAAICTKYGPPEVLKIKEVEQPTPTNTEILVKVHASTVSSPDRRIRGLNVPYPVQKLLIRLFFGIKKPKNQILGRYMSGEVIAVGEKVRKYKIGDQIFAQGKNFGGYAEYVCLPANGKIEICPNNISLQQAAAIAFGGSCALHFLKRKGNVNAGQKILIYGASGAVGSAAVQIAKYFGAEITGVCSTSNLDLVKSLGADNIIDYTKDDVFSRKNYYDLVFDAVGKTSYKKCSNALVPKGKFVSVFSSGTAKILTQDFTLLKTLVEEGKFTPVIDKTFNLKNIVEAHEYADTERTKGNNIISTLN